MRVEQTLLLWLWVAMDTVANTCLLDATYGHFHEQRPRRFLFAIPTLTTPPSIYSSSFCNYYCNRRCPNGYARAPSGCYMCTCAQDLSTSVTTPALTHQLPSGGGSPDNYTHTITGGVLFDKPCNPALRHCTLKCPNGFKLGTNGCQYCICSLPVIPVTLPTTTAMTHSAPSTVISSTISTASPTTLPTTRVTTASLTTATAVLPPAPVHEQFPYTDPCIPSQKTCKKACGGNYIKGPQGCQYCLCDPAGPSATTTTTAQPASSGRIDNSSNVPKPVQHTASVPSSQACLLAKLICNQKCPNGFIIHPSDCLYCGCDKKSEDPIQADEGVASLQNPCVPAEPCDVHCFHGYRTRSDGCQYCSCR